jgi:hypothetical protein
MSDPRARARARTHADEIGEIGDENAPPNLTNLVTPITNLVTNLVTTKQQVRSNLTNLVTSFCV